MMRLCTKSVLNEKSVEDETLKASATEKTEAAENVGRYRQVLGAPERRLVFNAFSALETRSI
jgi:hypothetical protein